MKNMNIVLGFVLTLQISLGLQANAQQTDSSSFFPLGLWGIWLDQTMPPYIGTADWATELPNFVNINANYLSFWIPTSVEDDLLDFCDQHNYRMDIMNASEVPYGPLVNWIKSELPLFDSMTAEGYIRAIQSIGSSHQTIYTYTVAHEDPEQNSAARWPKIEYATRRIHELDAGKKTYAVVAGVPFVEFFDAIPNLDVVQEDRYNTRANMPAIRDSQQAALDDYSFAYTLMMNRLKGRNTEWHAVIQTQHDYRNTGCENALRRPNICELRAQT